MLYKSDLAAALLVLFVLRRRKITAKKVRCMQTAVYLGPAMNSARVVMDPSSGSSSSSDYGNSSMMSIRRLSGTLRSSNNGDERDSTSRGG